LNFASRTVTSQFTWTDPSYAAFNFTFIGTLAGTATSGTVPNILAFNVVEHPGPYGSQPGSFFNVPVCATQPLAGTALASAVKDAIRSGVRGQELAAIANRKPTQ
jgi:hypothetical protein